MSDLLAIVGPADGDERLLAEIVRRRPNRVTVLVESADRRLGDRGVLVRSGDAGSVWPSCCTAIEQRTGAVVVGTAGDPDQLRGWRFDRVVGRPRPRSGVAGLSRRLSQPPSGRPAPVRCLPIMTVALAPDDVVRTHAEGEANEREPLLVLDPLISFLQDSGLEAPQDLQRDADR